VSYSQPQAARRPGIVTTAAYLMVLVGVLELVNAIANLLTMNTILDAARRAYTGLPNADTVIAAMRASQIAGVALAVLVAVGFVILAAFNLRGSNAARIVTWVVTGIGVLCFGCGAIGVAATGFLTNLQPGSTAGPDPGDAARRISAATPGWLKPTSLTIEIVNLLAVILIIILLALPAANEYFRRRGAMAEIPVMPYPSVPGYPPAAPETGEPAAAETGFPPAAAHPDAPKDGDQPPPAPPA